jgi:type IV secretory pathway VirB2 component (pilin)
MSYRVLAIAVACSACGTVHNQPTDAAADGPAQAQLTFLRTDLSGPLAWMVTIPATLLPQ